MSGLARLLGVDSWIPGSGLLNGLSAAIQVGSYAPDLLHFTQRETTPIHQLQRAIDGLQNALVSGKYEQIQATAKEAQAQLHAILADEGKYKENFRNYSSFRSWATYFTPLNNLMGEVDTYLSAHFGRKPDGLVQLIAPAKKLVDAEVIKQKGIVAHTLEAALDTVVARVQDEVSEHFGHGQEKQVAEQAQKLPPLLRLQKQIAYYRAHPEESIPAVVDEELRIALHELDRSSPLFAGIEAAVLHERDSALTPQSMLSAINTFLFERTISNPDPQLHQFFYLVAHESKQVPEQQVTGDKEAQIAWGKAFLEGSKMEFEGDGVSFKKVETLWVAIVQLDELAKLTKVMQHLEMSPADSLRTLSDKVDQALSFFESNPYSSGEVMHQLATTMKEWLDKIFTLSKDRLEKGDRTKLGALLTQANRFINQGNHIEALKVLKKGFETKALATQMGQFDPRSKPQSAVAQLVESYEKQSEAQQAEAPQRNWQGELNLQRKNLVENLTYFSTFQVMEKMCASRSPAESERAFAEIHDAIKDLEGEEKEARFMQLIKAKIEKNPNKGFFGKLYAKGVVSFVSHIVRYFAEHFTSSLTEHLTSLIHRPHENPLESDHLSPVQSVNNALVAYLQAEERVSSDPQGREAGGLGKRLRMKHFLEQPDLNGGFEMQELVNKVVDKAIKEFLHIGIPSKPSQWNDRLAEWQEGAQSTGGKIGKNALAYLGRFCLLPLRALSYIANAIYSNGMKWGASLLLSQLDIVNSVLDSANKALYDNAQFTSSIDEVLLENLRVFEKLLDQEGGEPRLYEGDNGKRLFEELVNNLFSVLDRRGQLTPEQEERRDSLLIQSKEALEDMADEKLKETVRDLLIFAYQSIRTEEHMNGLLLTLFTNANNALLPGKNPIHTFYSAKQKADISMQVGLVGAEPSDQDLLIHFALFESGKISREEIAESTDTLEKILDHQPSQGELIIYYRTKPEILTRVTRVDLDNALKRKYQRAEEEIRVILARILKKSVEDVVVSQAETLLKTPENALIDYLTWMEHQFIPQSAAKQTLQPSYIEVMRQQIALYEKSEEPHDQLKHLQQLHTHHLHMMRQMQSSLTVLASKERSGNSIDNKIRSVYELSERELFPLLQRISEQILAFQATKKPEDLRALEPLLQSLEQQMQARAMEIHAMKHAIQHEDGSFGEKVRQWKDWAIQGAAEPCVHHITDFVHGRLNKRAQEAIHMYKDPNTLPLMMRHVLGLSYLQREAPSIDARPLILHA